MAKKSAVSKGYRRQAAKKPYLSKRDIAIVCVIAALLAVGAFFLFRYDDGALKVQDGAVVVDGDNWLIADGSNVRGRARYFRLGEIGEVEGCSLEKGALATDQNIPEYVFTPADTQGVTVTVTCGHGSAETMAKYAHSVLESSEVAAGEIQTGALAGLPARWYSYVAGSEAAADAQADEAAAAGFSHSVAGYIDASHDCCVILNAVSRADTDADCLPDDALQALMEKAAAALRLDNGA